MFFFSFRLAEGEQILTGGVLNKQKSQDDIVTEFGDSSCFTLALLGQIYWCVPTHTHSLLTRNTSRIKSTRIMFSTRSR